MDKTNVVAFENKDVRKVWCEGQWYFVVEDVAQVLVESKNIKDYLNKLRQRDPELDKGYGQFVRTLDIQTGGGKQKMNCANLQGIFRIIQSIPSPKAEPFKLWLAKVGQERIEELQDPEKSLNRARENWKKHGRSDKWIGQRMLGQETRNKLTDYWSNNDVKKGEEFAILTNIIHEEWSEVSVQDHKKLKGLGKQNLRDHMSEAELIFTSLAELSTRQIAETMEAKGLDENKIPAKEGGRVAKNARVELEQKTGKKVISRGNFLPPKK